MASAALVKRSKFDTFTDVLDRVGHVSTDRILLNPTPGTATEADVFNNAVTGGRICELVDGILVQKAMGYRDDAINFWLGYLLQDFAVRDNLGCFAGSQGPIKLKLDLVRIPDISFIRWDSVDDTDVIEAPGGPCLEAVPDLVVEVLSPSNTKAEMAIKLAEYAKAGVRLVWYVDPVQKNVTVYPNGKERGKKVLGLNDTLDGGTVMPGLQLLVAKIFEERTPVRKPGKKGKK